MLTLDWSLSLWTDSCPPELEGADEWVLRYDCFLGDLIFIVDEVDLSARWGWVPVLDLALGLVGIVHGLGRDGNAEGVFEFTESDATITFRRDGDMVEIEASYAPRAARVSYNDLQAAAKRFAVRVLDDLVRQHPALCRNAFIVRVIGSIDVNG